MAFCSREYLTVVEVEYVENPGKEEVEGESQAVLHLN